LVFFSVQSRRVAQNLLASWLPFSTRDSKGENLCSDCSTDRFCLRHARERNFNLVEYGLPRSYIRIYKVRYQEIHGRHFGCRNYYDGRGAELYGASHSRYRQQDVDLVVMDLHVPGSNGAELAKRITETWHDLPLVVLSACAAIGDAVEILKAGARDYIVKPLKTAAIEESVRTLLEKSAFFREMRELRRRSKDSYQFGRILSTSPDMHRLFETIRVVSPTETTVVIEGETGTGKELVARTIHNLSARRAGPFVTINCGGFPETLLESELFGYERGAFTGADQARPGKIELAHGGTLFLDEIENMPLSMQTKLLLVLQDHKVQRLGSARQNQVDMRVITASCVPLKELVKQGKMRKDFYYRIQVIRLRLPPLRRRLDDLPLLVQDFLRHHPIALKKQITGISPAALEQLTNHRWPGNIRELRNVLEKAVLLCRSRVLASVELEGEIANRAAPRSEIRTPVSHESSLSDWIREQERNYLIQKLRASQGRIDETAKTCGVGIRTLHRKMRSYGLHKRAFNKKDRASISNFPRSG
jgi:two-component system response regulator HydG